MTLSRSTRWDSSSGAAVAERLGVAVVPARKGRKLPVADERVTFVDYSGTRKALEMRRDALSAGDRS